MADVASAADSAAPELAHLLTHYRAGSLDRRAMLTGIARLAGGAAAAALLLPILEASAAEASPVRAVTLSLQELSDRLEIRQNVWDFANAIDLQAWDMLDTVFTADAELAYGGFTMRGPAIKAGLRELFTQGQFRSCSHMMLDPRIVFAGDGADSQTRCLNPLEANLPDGRRQARYHFAWYRFQHVRVAEGWRIRRRVLGASEPSDIHWQTPPFSEARSRPPRPYQET